MMCPRGIRAAAPPPRISQSPLSPSHRSVTPPPAARLSISPLKLSLLPKARSLRSVSVPPPRSRREDVSPARQTKEADREAYLAARHIDAKRQARSSSVGRRGDNKLVRSSSQRSLQRSDSHRSIAMWKSLLPKSPKKPMFNSQTASSWSETLRRTASSGSLSVKKAPTSPKSPTSMTADEELAKSAKLREKYLHDHDDIATTLEAAEKAAEEGEKLIRYLTLREHKLAHEENYVNTASRRINHKQRFDALQKEKKRAAEALEDAYRRVDRDKHRLAQARANLAKQKASSLHAISHLREEQHEHDIRWCSTESTKSSDQMFVPHSRPHEARDLGGGMHDTFDMLSQSAFQHSRIGSLTPYSRPHEASVMSASCKSHSASVPSTSGSSQASATSASDRTYRGVLDAGSWKMLQFPPRGGGANPSPLTGHPCVSAPVARKSPEADSPQKRGNMTPGSQRPPVAFAAKERLMRKMNSMGAFRINPRKPQSTTDYHLTPTKKQPCVPRQQQPRGVMSPQPAPRPGVVDDGGESEAMNTALRDIIQTAESLQDKWNSLPPELQAKLQVHYST